MYVRLVKSFTFEAAHSLPSFPEGHKCRRLHGHSYRVDVVVAGEVDPEKGYLIDFADVRAACEPIRSRLDHYYLNEIDGLENPTAEMLAAWIWKRLKPTLPQLVEIVIHETCLSRCEFRGD